MYKYTKRTGKDMSITKQQFGTMPTGEEVYLYTLDNGEGVRVEFLNLGCIIRRLIITDKSGKETDIVLGRDTLEQYLNNVGNLGATVGRVANRIRHGRFEINGEVFQGEPNQRGHMLHSGWANFAFRLWQVSYDSEDDNSISFEIKSPDGENGFPGDLDAVVTFTLEGTSLINHYEAVANKDTIIGFTNHSYFNLNGHDSGGVLEHSLRINADFITPMDDTLIPTGEITSVKNTPFDFTELIEVGKYIKEGSADGYDHNFVLRGNGLREAVYIKGDKTNIGMTIHTDKPGLQFYIAQFFNGTKVYKDGIYYGKDQAVCLEAQMFPNSTEYSHFPSAVVKCGDKYDYTTIYSFDFE